jgi:DNA-binding transcriptional LysR family regulator
MPVMLDPDQLRTLVAIAETGSFTRAADEVHKTQSAVSMQMKRLEETLGRTLFEKDGRLSRLTPDGLRLVEYGRRLLRLNEEAVASFRAPGLSGHVRLGTPDDYIANLPEILARFARQHSSVEVTIMCEPTQELLKRIDANDIDLSIITYVQHAPRARVFRRERLLWVTSDRHCAHEEPVVPLALGRPQCNWRGAAILALDTVGRRHRIVFTSWNASVVGQAVVEGLAVSVLPESALRPGMRVLRAEDGFPELPYAEVALLKPGGATNPAVDALERHIICALDNISTNLAAAAE